MRIDIYDTTLRDGTQGEGFNLSLSDKLQIAKKLDELGVDYIEGGFPLSNPKDEAFFKEVRTMNLRAKVSAFGMTRRRGVRAQDDPGMRALLDAQTPAITIVGKTSPFQVEHVLNVTREENLAMITESIALMVREGREVIYDAEHFFDAYRADRDYALATLKAAEGAGAVVLCLCDTNGGSLPEQIAEAVRDVKAHSKARIGIHTHNDAGLAIANAQAAIAAGASHAQGTINGVGERCGNMDLIPLIANLNLKLGHDVLRDNDLSRLTEVSRFVYEVANMNLVNGQPYVGSSAFAHKGGMHVHAVLKHPSTYEHIDPNKVGNARKVLVSELGGASNIAAKAGAKFDVLADKDMLRRVQQRVQELENAGYHFEAADASFELLVRREIGRYQRFFDLDHYRVNVLKRRGADSYVEAAVKLTVGQSLEHRVAEGNGPIDALYRALRQCLEPHHKTLADLHLIDYKVRVINSRDESAAAVRVVAEFRRDGPDGKAEHFGTIGVSGNVIDASWQAITDAVEYDLVRDAGL